MTRSKTILTEISHRGGAWGSRLVRQGMAASAAAHLFAAALLWASSWWMRGTASDPVMPYPPEQDFASISVPPASSEQPEAAPQASIEFAPKFQSPETRPLEPADTTLPRSTEQQLVPSGELVDRASPADQLGREGAPEVGRIQLEKLAERRQSEDLPEVGITTGSLARASSGVDTRMTPRPLLNPAPNYPSDALTRRIEGTVLLQVSVDASGAVAEVKLVRSSRAPSLDEAALVAVRQWRFLPARDPNSPIRRVNIPIEFTIRNR